MAARYKLLIDWIGDGDFTDAGDDVTLRTLDQRTELTVHYGRDQARQLSPTSPGEAHFELDNRSKDYSPENASSPLVGLVLPGRHVQLQATLAGATTTLFDGYLDDFDVKPDLIERSVDATCTDSLGRLRGVNITTPIYQGIRTGDAIGFLLDAAGWPSAQRDLDSGASFLPYWWIDNGDAYDALMALVDSEGPAALATVDSSGRIVFRDRHHRLTRSASLSVQSTWRGFGAEPLISAPVTYNHGWKEIVNQLNLDVPVRQVDGSASVVWSSQGQISIGAGETVSITARSSSGPFVGAMIPVQDVDYTALSGSVTITLSQDSGESTTLQIFSAGGALLQGMQLQAFAVQSTSIAISVEDTTSIGKYGPRAMQVSRLPVWANVYDALAILQLIIGKRAERLPTISVTMRGAANSVRLNQCLTRNLSDRVHVVEGQTGLDADCFIEQISHAIGQGGAEHVTTFGLEKIPAVVTNVFTFDVAGQGFDQGLFAQVGQDNPATMFRFDTGGQGFDQGLFAT
jgi:hypothetical protein